MGGIYMCLISRIQCRQACDCEAHCSMEKYRVLYMNWLIRTLWVEPLTFTVAHNLPAIQTCSEWPGIHPTITWIWPGMYPTVVEMMVMYTLNRDKYHSSRVYFYLCTRSVSSPPQPKYLLENPLTLIKSFLGKQVTPPRFSGYNTLENKTYGAIAALYFHEAGNTIFSCML